MAQPTGSTPSKNLLSLPLPFFALITGIIQLRELLSKKKRAEYNILSDGNIKKTIEKILEAKINKIIEKQQVSHIKDEGSNHLVSKISIKEEVTSGINIQEAIRETIQELSKDLVMQHANHLKSTHNSIKDSIKKIGHCTYRDTLAFSLLVISATILFWWQTSLLLVGVSLACCALVGLLSKLASAISRLIVKDKKTKIKFLNRMEENIMSPLNEIIYGPKQPSIEESKDKEKFQEYMGLIEAQIKDKINKAGQKHEIDSGIATETTEEIKRPEDDVTKKSLANDTMNKHMNIYDKKSKPEHKKPDATEISEIIASTVVKAALKHNLKIAIN